MESIKSEFSIFGDINTRQDDILKSDYVYKTLYSIDYSKHLRPNLSFSTNVSQKILPNKNFLVSNHGNISFLYKTNIIEVCKNFETNGNLKIDFLYNFQKVFSRNGFFFAKFLSNHSESKILPKIGIKLRTPHLKAEGNYDFEKTRFSNKLLLTTTRGSNDLEIEKYGLSLAFCSNLKYFSLYKTAIFYKSHDLDISLTHENPERSDNSFKKLNLLIYNKARDNLDIALRCKYDPSSDKNFKVILGGLTKISNNVDCKGKIDENFNVATAFLLKISDNIHLTLSSHFTLNPNPKKESIPHLPFGFRLSISDN